MAGLQKVAGSKIYIGGPAAYKSVVSVSDFSGATWTEIKGWATTGDLGSEQESITQALINENITLYSKGVISFPIMENVFTPIADDPGQVKFRAAQRSCKPYQFKIEWGADCGPESDVTITIASPGVISWSAHGLVAGTPVMLSTTGVLPTGLVAGQTYYVAASPAPAAGTFSLAASIGGAAIVTTVTQSGVHTAHAQEIGETDLLLGLAMFGTKTGGDASATRMLNAPIQPIAEYVTV